MKIIQDVKVTILTIIIFAAMAIGAYVEVEFIGLIDWLLKL